MIIDTQGNQLVAFLETNGVVIQDKPSQNPYNVFFYHIGLHLSLGLFALVLN